MSSDMFRGWVAHNATDHLKYTDFKPKPFTPTDIEIRVTHCGICGTDIHTLRSGWGPSDYPCVLGHEIVGIVVRIGAGVATLASSPASREIRVGDRVGIGAQSMSCLRADCEACADGRENCCSRSTATYNGRYLDEHKSKSYGGYANLWRGPAHFAFKIPDSLPSAEAAPLLCAGATVFRPLRRYNAGPGKSVGIIGVGGLGHLGTLFAKALGCSRVVAISRTSSKRKDAIEGLGADLFIATEEETAGSKKWEKIHSRSLDLIICTVDSPDLPLAKYLRLLKVGGTFVQVGAPDQPLPGISAVALIQKEVQITGSNMGSPEDIRQMLQLAAEKRVFPWIQKRPMSDVNSALADMDAGKARYRYVLENDMKSNEAKL